MEKFGPIFGPWGRFDQLFEPWGRFDQFWGRFDHFGDVLTWERFDCNLSGEFLEYIFYGLQSKRPQVKTSPSQNVPELVKTSPKIGQNVPMVKNVGQNVPKMIHYSIFYEILGII